METGPSGAQTMEESWICNCRICMSLVMKPSTEFFQLTYFFLQINNKKKINTCSKKYPMLEAVKLKS
jgi:hypothetical protein